MRPSASSRPLDGRVDHATTSRSHLCEAPRAVRKLSGRELADKLARGWEHIHAWRVEMLAHMGEQETSHP
jgi:hypothetical protein